MDKWSLAGLLTELEVTLAWLRKSAAGVFRAFRRAAAIRPAPHVTQFGDYERIEETKYFPLRAPAPLEAEEAELPDRYGKTRLVLMAVDPYLIHVYWEVASEQIDEASKGAPQSQPVLRFYETMGASPTGQGGEWFDVDVALEPRNWQVRLWSPDKSYVAEIGLRRRDGSFVRLARSNLARTPRAWPVAPVEERYMRVEPRGRRVLNPEVVKRSTTRTFGAISQAGSPLPFGPMFPGALLAGVVPPSAGGSSGIAATGASSGGAGSRVASIGGGSAEVLSKKLAELYALRESRPEALESRADASAEAPQLQPSEAGMDLSRTAERDFTAGVSSALLPERRVKG